MRLHIDFETRSTINLPKTGVHRYAEDLDTDVILACWAVDDFAVETWFHIEPNNKYLMQLLADPSVTIVAHNAGFERCMIKYILGPRYGWPIPADDRWDDTAARAARQALPRSLADAAAALGLNVAKDMEGKRLMMQMCRPRRIEDDGTIVWWEDEDRMQRLAAYCATDVEVERELDRVLRPFSETERSIFLLTETINDRGVAIDVPFVNEALTLATSTRDKLNAELQQITNGEVVSLTSVTQMKDWLLQQGFALFEGEDESLNKKTVDNLLSKQLPENVRRVLQLRKDGGKSSVAKYEAMRERVNKDGRVRGNLVYHGASTGRWAGAGVQLQNLPRDAAKDWDKARNGLRKPDAATMAILSSMIRGTIKAEEGHKLMWADYAAIEARGVAWLSGQNDLVDTFATGGKVYEEMAAKIFEKDASEIGKDGIERFLGKTVILGAGYSMGAAKFRMSCAAMGVDVSEELAQKAIQAYRQGYPYIPKLWRGLDDAAINAVRYTKRETCYGNIAFYCNGDWLMMQLPSMRKLYYRSPRLITAAGPYGDRPQLEYMAVNSVTKKWSAERTYGGKLTENAVQGICRDLIAGAMLDLEAAGYPVIASVHDEVVCEVPLDGPQTIEEMIGIMCRVPDWAAGFPIAAEGKEALRYGK